MVIGFLRGSAVRCAYFGLRLLLCGILTANGALCLAADAPPEKAMTTNDATSQSSGRFPLLRIGGTSDSYIAAPAHGVDRAAWLKQLRDYRAAMRTEHGGFTLYDRPAQQWLTGAFTCHFTFMYDRAFYNPETGRYTLDSLLHDGKREFGGYDILVLWHAYPRIGLDARNQLDYYRDMPGGLPAIRGLVDQAHARGARVFINYNPWDQSTGRTGRADDEFLADLMRETDMDGVFLDTMPGVPAEFLATLERARPGIVLCPEISPSFDQMAICTSAWAQTEADTLMPPGLLLRKWVAPRLMLWQIWRWQTDRTEQIRQAFFNGSGILVWENAFGVYNPWRIEDRLTWRRAVAILRRYQANFSSDAWDPFYPALQPDLYIHRWPGATATIFTLKSMAPPAEEGPRMQAMDEALFEVPASEYQGIQFYDAWSGAAQPLRMEHHGTSLRVFGRIERATGLGCVVAVSPQQSSLQLGTPLLPLDGFLHQQAQLAPTRFVHDTRNFEKPLTEPEPITPTALAKTAALPAGMVLVPGGAVHMQIEHMRRECGCYPDPGTPPTQWECFVWGNDFTQSIRHDYTVALRPFAIDEAAVSNAQFAEFLRATGYAPREPQNFLKHWAGDKPVAGQEDWPVVNIDLDDARAYARWTGKRLPTEPEWHLAAQGTDGRLWPWGNEFDAARVNQTGQPLPVHALPASRSPYGCYQMAGNVYELTESLRDDGHTRFLIVRGGSYFQAPGSIWYFDGGPRPCNHHAKLLLMSPSLDRSPTIGFRCVKDVE